MSVTPKDHISNFPIPPNVILASHTTSVQAPGLGGRTFTSPTGSLRTLTAGGTSVKLNPTSQTSGDMLNTLTAAGIAVTLDRFGRLVFTGVNAVGGDNDLLVALGLA